MTRSPAFVLRPLLALGVGFAMGCEGSSSSSGGTSGDIDGGGAGFEAGTTPGVEGGATPSPPPPGAANTILGLSSRGSIVRIGLSADGKDEDLGTPTYNGQELRVRAIASGAGGLYAIEPGSKAGSNLVRIDLPGLNVVPVNPENDFRARYPGKEGLAFGGSKVFGSGQFGPVVELALDGVMNEFILRQANSETDDTQCSTPEDLVWQGGLLAAGTCNSADPDKAGYWVWEYLFGLPGTTGQGGTLTNKSMRHRSPERMLGLGVGMGGLVATSAQGNLLVQQGRDFVVLRQLTTSIIDLE